MSKRNQHHYLPVDDRSAEWGFYLTTAGRVLDPVDPGLPYGVHSDKVCWLAGFSNAEQMR